MEMIKRIAAKNMRRNLNVFASFTFSFHRGFLSVELYVFLQFEDIVADYLSFLKNEMLVLQKLNEIHVAFFRRQADHVYKLLGSEFKIMRLFGLDFYLLLFKLNKKGIVYPPERVTDHEIFKLAVRGPYPLAQKLDQTGRKLRLGLNHSFKVGF